MQAGLLLHMSLSLVVSLLLVVIQLICFIGLKPQGVSYVAPDYRCWRVCLLIMAASLFTMVEKGD